MCLLREKHTSLTRKKTDVTGRKMKIRPFDMLFLGIGLFCNYLIIRKYCEQFVLSQ